MSPKTQQLVYDLIRLCGNEVDFYAVLAHCADHRGIAKLEDMVDYITKLRKDKHGYTPTARFRNE